MRMPLLPSQLIVTFAFALSSLTSAPVLAQPTWDNPPPNLVRGEILKPAPGSTVGRAFPVGGTAGGQIRNLWLVVRIGDLYWPKEPKLILKNGKWDGSVNEGGNPPGGRFEVILLDVTNKTSEMFEDWMRQGHASHSYPGISKSAIEGARELDRREFHL
jgi:hypothetical protein